MDSSYGCQRRRLIGAGKAGRSIVAIDPLARRATTVYDPAGRAIVEINANGGRQTTTYDAAGRRIGLRDPRGYRMSFTYDAVGQAISEVNAVGSRMTFSYDANSQRVGRLDPRGISTTWTYDAANRMRSRRQPGGQIVTWTHDPTGNLVQLETPLGRYTRTFDPADNVLLMTTPEDQTLQWVRDPLGRRKVLIDPDGGRTTYTCNGLGQVTKLVNAHLERTTTVYDPAGRETRLELDNGTVTTTIYDAAGQTVRVAHVGFENFDYTYDAAGRRTGLVESTGDRLTWSYDPTGQLVGEARSGANAYATTYVYDPSGNRLVEITETNRTTSVYDGFNRLLKSDSLSGITTYSYDPAGNRTRLEDPSGDLTTYTWNAENHLVQTELPSGDVVTTLWDPINKNAEERIVRRDDGATTTHYLWDNNNILRETDDVGATAAEYTYIPQPYGDLVSQRREAESHFYQFDALGSATGLTDETGAVTDEYRYKAFGETVSETGSTENPYQWVGQVGYRKDEATGLLNLRGREVDPETAQFTSADPKGLEAGDSNFYRYVANDPATKVDPSGFGIGHHYFPVTIIGRFWEQGVLTEGARLVALGFFSGDLFPPHGNTAYGGVQHNEYNELIAEEFKKFLKDNNYSKKNKVPPHKMQEFINKYILQSKNKQIKDFLKAIAKDRATWITKNGTRKIRPPKYDLESLLEQGRKCAKTSRILKKFAAGAFVGVLLGALAESVQAVEIASRPNGAFAKAINAIEEGELIRAEKLLFGTFRGYTEKGFYDELIEEGLGQAALNAVAVLDAILQKAHDARKAAEKSLQDLPGEECECKNSDQDQ